MIGYRHEIDGVWYVEVESNATCNGCDYYKKCKGNSKGICDIDTILKKIGGTVIKEDVMQDYKIYVGNEEISRLVQEKAFKLGYSWAMPFCKEVLMLDQLYLLLDEDGRICHNFSSMGKFKDNISKEISFHAFLDLPEPSSDINVTIGGVDTKISKQSAVALQEALNKELNNK